MRDTIGVDWADAEHAIWVEDAQGNRVVDRAVSHTAEGLAEWGRWLDEHRGAGVELWAAIERPDGRVVDFLLDHGVIGSPGTPKALDRARDRFRTSQSKSDPFDAHVLAAFLRTDQAHLAPLQPRSDAAQELKLLTRDYARLVRAQTRLVTQRTVPLQADDPRALELCEDLTANRALALLRAYATPEALGAVTRPQWQRFARTQRGSAEQRATRWELLQQPQLPVPAHVVRAKARLVGVLVTPREAAVHAVDGYREAVATCFGQLPAAAWAPTLPAGHGMLVPTIWGELGAAPGRWTSWQHLQGHAGAVPVTVRSGKHHSVAFRFACNKRLRTAVHQFALCSLQQCEWARVDSDRYRQRGHRHHAALRALGAKWLKIIFVLWSRQIPYREEAHLATMARQHLRQAA